MTQAAATGYRFWCEEKLRNADTDQQGHVNNAIMATLLEAARIELLAAAEIEDIRAATQIVVAKQLIVFKKELFFPGIARIGTRCARVGRTSLDFVHTIQAANSEVATAETTCVLLDRTTRKPTAVPERLRTYLTGE